MKNRLVFVAIAMLLLTNIEILAQQRTSKASTELAFGEPSSSVAFWVAYWSKPRVVLFGPEEQAFNKSVHEVTFAHDRFDHALDENTLNADVQWLKDHPNARFFVEGYASVTGTEAYNLNLSGQRAEWVEQLLIRKGIAPDRIVLAVPWGMLYPACTEATEECHAKNRVVRLVYSPN